jgi:hypothetical protein
MSSPSVTLQSAIREAVFVVRPGRPGWLKRLKSATENMQPHMNAGRMVVYQKLVKELKHDLEEYALRKSWPSSWKDYCEDRIDEFFDFYITIPILKQIDNKDSNTNIKEIIKPQADSTTFIDFAKLCTFTTLAGLVWYYFT